MPKPVYKVEGIENVLSGMIGGKSRTEEIEKSCCVRCSKPAIEFKDALSMTVRTTDGQVFSGVRPVEKMLRNFDRIVIFWKEKRLLLFLCILFLCIGLKR